MIMVSFVLVLSVISMANIAIPQQAEAKPNTFNAHSHSNENSGNDKINTNNALTINSPDSHINANEKKTNIKER